MKKRIGMLVCCLGAVLLGSCHWGDESPRIEPLRFERISNSHVLATGSWQLDTPTGWPPYALVFIECRRATEECTEMWARIVSDEHGVKGDLLMPEITRYQIAEWSGSEIRATGRYREKWPVQLSLDVEKGAVRRESLGERDNGGAESWVLK